MLNPLRQFVSVALTFSILSANGLYFAPLLIKQRSDKESTSMQNCCCCCNSGGTMSAACCCAARHSGRNDHTTCSVSSAPCAAPLTALSPNALDQWIDLGFSLNKIMVNATSEKFPRVRESLLSGIANSLYHPPQSSLLPLS